MPRILLDTSVLFSAYGFRGKPRALLDDVIDGVHDLVTSPALLAELARALYRIPGMDDARVRQAIVQLIRISDVVEPARGPRVCRDPDDDRVLECAVAGNVDLIVTGDEDLLCLAHYAGIPIVRVSDV
jgi:putative PIN family toxin of toxin-antitoxin system